MRSWLPFAALGSAACSAPESLLDVPIVGATAREEGVIRAELAAFERAVGVGRAPVRRIIVKADLGPESADGRWVGQWQVGRRRLLVRGGLRDGDLADIVRHELCHALDTAEGPFADRQRALFDRWMGALDPRTARDDVEKHGDAELFAQTCERGPLLAQLASEPCPDDPSPDVAAWQAWLAEDVWNHETLVGSAALSAVGSFPTPGPPIDASVATTVLPDVMSFAWTLDGGEHQAALFNVWTGAVVDASDLGPPTDFPGWDLPFEVAPVLPTFAGMTRNQGRADGPGWFWVEMDLGPLGVVNRAAWTADGEVRRVGPGCLAPELFWAEEHVFAFDLDGVTPELRWSIVGP